MPRPKVLSAALIAATMLATPAMARESHITSRHFPQDINARTTPGARVIGAGGGFRANHFGSGLGGTPGDEYEGRDVWGHWGTYYGPMVPAL
jgi:hypothetical protein